MTWLTACLYWCDCNDVVDSWSDSDSVAAGVGMMGASRKANFAPPARGYTGVGSGRTAVNRPAAELGNWSTTYTNSYEVGSCSHAAVAAVQLATAVAAVLKLLLLLQWSLLLCCCCCCVCWARTWQLEATTLTIVCACFCLITFATHHDYS